MDIDVIWYKNKDGMARGWWDQSILERLLNGRIHKPLWKPVHGYNFKHHEGIEDVPDGISGAIIILPARQLVGEEKAINEYIAQLRWVLIMAVGDEDREFNLSILDHPNMELWIMTPKPSDAIDFPYSRPLINGFTPDTIILDEYEQQSVDKSTDVFFSGQVTHKTREECMAAVDTLSDEVTKDIVQTEGFTRGLDHNEYYRRMASSRIVLCPSGPITSDTFRLYETLESSSAVPIADCIAGKDNEPNRFWQQLFANESIPFTVIDDYRSLNGHVQAAIADYPRNANRISAWWLNYKRKMAYNLTNDVRQLTGASFSPARLRDKLTVIIPTSPIRSHPETTIIEETVLSIRHHLPDCEIIITADGVRPEQGNRRADYEEYLRRLLWKCHHEWSNVLVKIFEEHSHQVKMLRNTIDDIKTDLIMYVEQDAPLVIDYNIPFNNICGAIYSGDVSLVRFAHEAIIIPEHRHLMIDSDPIYVNSVPLVRTVQFSARPHITSVAWYRRVLGELFSPNANSFIEDRAYGPIVEAYNTDGMLGWQEYRLAIYHPTDGNIKRSYHTDGRAGEEKWTDKQVF